MAKFKKPPEKEEPIGAAPPVPRLTTGKLQVNQQDALIREFGFKVHMRPKGGIVLWIRNTKLYTQGEALAAARLSRDTRDEKAKHGIED